MIQTLSAGLAAAKDQGDKIPQLVLNVIVWLYDNRERVASAVVVALVVYVLTKAGLVRWLFTKVGLLGTNDLNDVEVMERNHNRAKYMVRESGKLIASALEKRQTSPVEAYEQALQAAVLTRTAKEIHDDTARLSKELGVDFLEYLTYTTTVVQELRPNALK
jgi:biotin synthase-related radical SAM superfamily protein